MEKPAEQFSKVVCVDDGSSDGGAITLIDLPCTVVTHPINLGQGAALQTGVEFALRDRATRFIVTFDADGQHRVEDAVTMRELLQSSGVDIVFGSRFLRDGGGPTGLRRSMLRLAVVFTNLASGLKLTDTHNGLRAFNRRFAETLHLEADDMNHASEFIFHTAHGGLHVRRVAHRGPVHRLLALKGQPLMNAVNIALDSTLDLLRKGRKP